LLVFLIILIGVLGFFLITKIPFFQPVAKVQEVGTAEITITSVTAISLTDSTITMSIVRGESNDSNATNDWFTIENTGTENVDVDANITGHNFVEAVTIECKCENNTSGICEKTYGSCQTTGHRDLIWCLDYHSGTDTFDGGLNIATNIDEATGAKDINVTFYAEENASC